MKKLKAKVVNPYPLTKKEAVVLRYLCEGCSRVEIAKSKVYRELSTINRHVESIASKLDCHNHADIVATAVSLNMVEIKHLKPNAVIQRFAVFALLANVTFGHLDMRGPRSPRPIRTARTTSRIVRTARQYS